MALVARLLVCCVVLLALLYLAKVSLLYTVVEPMVSTLTADAEEEPGGLASDGLSADGSGEGKAGGPAAAAARALRRGDHAQALEHLRTCTNAVPAATEEASVADGMSTSDAGSVGPDKDGACCELLGEMRLVGAGISRNLTEAERLFNSAAQVGNADAQYNLGIHYSNFYSATNPRRSEALAVLHFYAASTAGHPGALMAMGYRHQHGYGVPKACTTAALNYIEVAKKIANVYSTGMPQAVELIRLNLHQKDRKALSSSQMNLFVQIAASGDTSVAAAVGKRYLLGIDGLRQDYRKAQQYLRIAGDGNHAGALALLGYMYCLGLGVPKNLDIAYSYFVSSSVQKDSLGHNGLGFIYFHGTTVQARNMRLAFHHFNESAYGGSSDGMFNLASMYLTGTGVEQSFQKAVLWYTQALERGHTPAAYSLAVMHLNGVGTVRDCDIAVNLLKKVCERGEWVSGQLVDAYEFADTQPEKATLLFLKLAEAGHEVAQMNAAHLLDSGQSWLLERDAVSEEPTTEMRLQAKVHAQRFYEMSAEQGSASSELRLGDYAYYGWGVAADFLSDDDNATAEEAATSQPVGQDVGDDSARDDWWDGFVDPELRFFPQPVDYEAALAHYRKTAEMQVTGEWMQAFVARASFNVGFMHQFSLGVPQDLHLAKRNYQRCVEVDPSGVHTPVMFMLLVLGAHSHYLKMPTAEEIGNSLVADVRFHVLLMNVAVVCVLLLMRQRFAQTVPRHTEQPVREATAGQGSSSAERAPPVTQQADTRAGADDPGLH